VRSRYSGIPTFFRAPYEEDLAQVDIGVVGIPYDGGVTNRPGSRHGPRDIRTVGSDHLRPVNQATGVSPFTLGLNVRDIGDIVIERPFNIEDSHADIEIGINTLLDN
jgi:guanidinopropionase